MAATPSDSLWMGVAGGIFFGWSIIISSLRIASKMKFTGPWGIDDSVLMLAQFLALPQVVAVYCASLSGYDGIRQSKKALFEKGLYAGQLFYIASLFASKCSMVLLLARMTQDKTHRRICRGVLALICTWAMSATAVIAFRGDLTAPWSTLTSSELYFRWIGVEAASMITELAIYGVTVRIVWSLQVKPVRKFSALCVAGGRLLLLPLLAVRLYYLSPDHVGRTVEATIFEEVVVNWSIIAATMPVLRKCFDPYVNIRISYDEEGKPILGLGFIHMRVPPEQIEREAQEKATRRESELARDRSWDRGERPWSMKLRRWMESRLGRRRPDSGQMSTLMEMREHAFDGRCGVEGNTAFAGHNSMPDSLEMEEASSSTMVRNSELFIKQTRRVTVSCEKTWYDEK